VYRHVADSGGAVSRLESELIFDRNGAAFIVQDVI
jgi:hypothetical protein